MLESIIGEKKSFDNPKPINLISRIIEFSSNKDSIILDFFAGSGTTGHAVLALNEKDKGNRQFILCQLNEKTDTTPNGIAYDVTCKRLKRIMTGECYDGNRNYRWAQDNVPYGDNLDVLEIDTVFHAESTQGRTPFDVIDETLYGQEKFGTLRRKVEWVCQNFPNARMRVEGDEEWKTRERRTDDAARS